jgi:hypothetical protein
VERYPPEDQQREDQAPPRHRRQREDGETRELRPEREAVGERIKAQEYLTACQNLLDRHGTGGFKLKPLAGGNLKLYVADLCFNNLSDEQEKEYFNNLPTSCNLSETEVDRLIEVGGRLLIEHPEYKKFMGECR